LSGEMTAQAPARGVADLELFDQGGILQSALVEITYRFGVVIELLSIEHGGLLEDSGDRVVCRTGLLLQVGEALAEGQVSGQLDKTNQVATLATAVAVEEIFAGVDVERRPGFGVQGTKPDKLGTATGRLTGPVPLPQIIK